MLSSYKSGYYVSINCWKEVPVFQVKIFNSVKFSKRYFIIFTTSNSGGKKIHQNVFLNKIPNSQILSNQNKLQNTAATLCMKVNYLIFVFQK